MAETPTIGFTRTRSTIVPMLTVCMHIRHLEEQVWNTCFGDNWYWLHFVRDSFCKWAKAFSLQQSIAAQSRHFMILLSFQSYTDVWYNKFTNSITVVEGVQSGDGFQSGNGNQSLLPYVMQQLWETMEALQHLTILNFKDWLTAFLTPSQEVQEQWSEGAVSYTHLTLPTIYSV